MKTIDIALIVLGVWGTVVIIGAIVMSIAKLKIEANPFSKLLKNKENKKEEN
ncbi:MAG: hypothetical protein MJ245_00435 [Clostridia bacterium]|nr:hypothetical protein [Clostridia bacterium]